MSEELKGREQSVSNKGAIARIRRFFQDRKTTPETFPPRRESADDILAKTPLPKRNVQLHDISLYGLPIDFTATRRLAIALNEIKETPIDQFELAQLKPPAAVHEAIPWVASAIVHHYNPEVPVITPNEDDITAIKPWLRSVSHLLGKFSPQWQYKFGRFVERRADHLLNKTAEGVLKRLDLIGIIENPQSQFVPEIESLYSRVSKPTYEEDTRIDIGEIFDIFGEQRRPMVQVPIERKVLDLVVELQNTRRGSKYGLVNRQDYPLLASVIEITQFPSDDVDIDTAAVVGSEIMTGLEAFLKLRGIKNVRQAQSPVKTLDLFNTDTWTTDSAMRSLAETFAMKQVLAVKRSLPSILVEVEGLLPQSGPKTVDRVRKLAEDILILRKQGVSNTEIAQALFSKTQNT